jgi:hypothetical protein
MTPEGKVKEKVKAFLKGRGVWYCSPVTGGFGGQGLPDILCCWHGFFVAIETKAKGKRSNTTPLQESQLRQISEAGGIATVISDVDQMKELEERVIRLLSRPDRH